MKWREEEGAFILTGEKGVLRGGRDHLAKSGWGQLMESLKHQDEAMCLMWHGCSEQVGSGRTGYAGERAL